MERTMSQDPSPARVLRGRHRIGVDGPAVDGQGARTRIQEVALHLFIEEGYDKTSLREIAEKLGVTKAALYYHFPTKEDIVNSLVEDRIAQLTALLAWAADQPKTQKTRREFIRRYAEDLLGGRHEQIMRFFERNQTMVSRLTSGEAMRGQMLETVDILSEPSDPLDVQLRRSLAIFAIHASWFVLRERPATDEERREAALKLALDLVSDEDEDKKDEDQDKK
jgi:AcrR family transcriptional regulator